MSYQYQPGPQVKVNSIMDSIPIKWIAPSAVALMAAYFASYTMRPLGLDINRTNLIMIVVGAAAFGVVYMSMRAGSSAIPPSNGAYYGQNNFDEGNVAMADYYRDSTMGQPAHPDSDYDDMHEQPYGDGGFVEVSNQPAGMGGVMKGMGKRIDLGGEGGSGGRNSYQQGMDMHNSRTSQQNQYASSAYSDMPAPGRVRPKNMKSLNMPMSGSHGPLENEAGLYEMKQMRHPANAPKILERLEDEPF